MFSKKLGALTAGAVMIGSFYAAAPALAEPLPAPATALTSTYCGETIKDCSLSISADQVDVDSARARAGETITVKATGLPGKTASVRLYAVVDGRNPASPIVGVGKVFTGTADASGVAMIKVTLPTLEGSTGGGGYFVGFSDMKTDKIAAGSVVTDLFAIFAENGDIVGSTGGIGTTRPLVIQLKFGLPGQSVKAQALINGAWVDLGATATSAKANTTVFSSKGTANLQVAAPSGTAKGKYPIRLVNLTTGSKGPKLGNLTVGFKETQTPTTPTKPTKPGPDRPTLPSTGN